MVHVRDGRVSEEGGALVIDDRGWLRLPGPLRHRLGVTANAADEADAVVLRPAGDVPEPVVADVAATTAPARARPWPRSTRSATSTCRASSRSISPAAR